MHSKKEIATLVIVIILAIVSLFAVDFAVSSVSPINLFWSEGRHVSINESAVYSFSFWTWEFKGAEAQIEVWKMSGDGQIFFYPSEINDATFTIDGRSYPVNWTQDGNDTSLLIGEVTGVGDLGTGFHRGDITVNYAKAGDYNLRASIWHSGTPLGSD